MQEIAEFGLIDKIHIFNPKYLAQPRLDRINSNISRLKGKMQELRTGNPIIDTFRETVEPWGYPLGIKTPYNRLNARLDRQYSARQLHTSYGKPRTPEARQFDTSEITTSPVTRIVQNPKQELYQARLDTDPAASTIGREGERLASVGRLERMYRRR
jgi:hypothetical protein